MVTTWRECSPLEQEKDNHLVQPRFQGSNFYNIYMIFIELLQIVSVGRQRLSAKFQVLFRLIMGLISLVFLSVFLPIIPFPHLTLRDIIVCILAFIPTGWGLLLVSKPSYYLPCFLLFTLFWSSPYLFYKAFSGFTI